jgi:outer membrane protein assembly factor BamA
MLASSQQYRVVYVTEETIALKAAELQESFTERSVASAYIATLPSMLRSKGYITASIDSFSMDSTSAHIYIYFGHQYQWSSVSLRSQPDGLFDGFHHQLQSLKGNLNMGALQMIQQKLLDHLEENGHPFGKVFLDSIELSDGKIKGLLTVDRGPLYRIDSIRIYGDAKVQNEFLQRYLDLPDGSIYNRKKLNLISQKLALLNYLEEERPSDLTMLGTGSVLNLYLKPRKSSQVNALIGLLPNSNQLTGNRKLLLTVDANILLRNAFGSGESLGLVWQQLQPGSPRLNLLFEAPYVFRSPVGMHFSLDMYKRDSSFLNLNMNLGALYRLDERRTGSVYLQRRQSIISSINSGKIIQTRQLPEEMDLSSVNLGVSFAFFSTDYRFNPRKGNEFSINTSAGTKTIKKNPQILDLKDPSDPNFGYEKLYDSLKLNSYQFRVTASGAHFFPFGTQSTFKTGVQAGIFQSPSQFRNELFQIGGFKLLRGFDEESQFVSQYVIGTLEYRYLVGRNSNFFVFTDGGFGKHVLENNRYHSYISTGLGLSFETGAGIFNLAWAVGKRDDLEFNLRQSKVHIGFASYF